MDRRKREKRNPSQEFIKEICALYGDVYDDREEDSAPGGADWKPGQRAMHTSLKQFQTELAERGIDLSTAKIRKILIVDIYNIDETWLRTGNDHQVSL